MKTTVTWQGKRRFVAHSASGHDVVIDTPETSGGENQAPSPMEYILLGVGGCSSIDVVHILQKARQDVADCVCELTAERAETEPKVFTKIHLHFVVSGNDLTEKHVERAVSLSAEKYCSASLMLQKACNITHSFEIR